MNLPIFWSEVKANRTFTIIWCAALVFSTGANLAGNASSQPAGLNYDVLLLFSQTVINTTMMAAIFSMILGGLVISREEDDKTIEFLISHPVTRVEIALSKAAAFAFLVASFFIVLLIADFIFLEIFKTSAGYDRGALLGVWTSELVLVFFFGTAGILYSSFVTKGGAVVGMCIAVPLVTGILAMLGEMDNTLLRLLSYLSPYRYFDISAILSKGAARPGFIAVFLIIAAVFLAITFAHYKRKEFAN